MDKSKITDHIRIDERNHVEKPLLDQLAGLQWEILDLDKGHTPQVIRDAPANMRILCT